MAIVNLTDAERQFLLEVVQFRSAEIGEQIEHVMAECTADALDAATARAQVYVRLLRAYEAGTLDPTEEVVAELEKHRGSVLSCIKDEKYVFARGGYTAYTDTLLDELTACDSLLQRLEGG